MATIPEFYHKAVLEGRGLNPIFLVKAGKAGNCVAQAPETTPKNLI
jgi:hypothetical protein